MIEFKISNPSATIVYLASNDMVKGGLSIGASITLLLECDDVDVTNQKNGKINITHIVKGNIFRYNDIQIDHFKIMRGILVLVCEFEENLET